MALRTRGLPVVIAAALTSGLTSGACGGEDPAQASGSDGSSTDPTGDPSGSSSGSATAGTTATTATTATSAPGDSSSEDGGDDGPGPGNFDVGFIPDVPEVACGGKGGKGGGGGGNVELAYIWIANSAQSTVSKINTDTMEEEGRYQAKPAAGDPSRTSVNLDGDVAVANRNGGVAKFWANTADCEESNGQPGLQTSSGTNDVLPWEDEECRAWYSPFACNSNRPVAWTRGEWNESTCSYENEKLWTVCDSEVLLLDGDDGTTEQVIDVGGGTFMYGGAADADGNFWGLDSGTGRLIRVNHEDYTTLAFGLPPSGAYGITVDKEGRPWVCSSTVARFNLDTSDWSVSPDNSGGGGCMTDGDATIWHGTGTGMVGFDTETLDLLYTIPLPEYVHGISVDFAGKVWGVGFASNNAYRADPETLEVTTFNQLVGAYTYSDMTGFQLSSAGGGGVPQG